MRQVADMNEAILHMMHVRAVECTTISSMVAWSRVPDVTGNDLRHEEKIKENAFYPEQLRRLTIGLTT